MEIKTSMGTFQVEVRRRRWGSLLPPPAGLRVDSAVTMLLPCTWWGAAAQNPCLPATVRATACHAMPASGTPRCSVQPSPLRCAPPLPLQLYQKHAPKTVKNFLELARRGYYDGTVVSWLTCALCLCALVNCCDACVHWLTVVMCANLTG